MKEKEPIYEKAWFIITMLFTPLFPIGLFLLWRSKSTHRIIKILFTSVYLFAIYYTIQTQNMPILEGLK